MKDLLFFDSMVTPKIITVIYWLLLVSILLSGLGAMFMNQGGLFAGLGILIGGAIGVRIWCEMLIVLFKINANLQKIADK